MKAIQTILLLGCVCPALAAQQPPPQERDKDAKQQQEQAKEKEKDKMAQEHADMARSGTVDLRKGETVLGADIHRAPGTDGKDKGEKIGEIKNLLVRAQDGTIGYAVVSLDDTGGDKLFALPIEVLKPRMSSDKDELTFEPAIDAERLRGAPSFDEDHWPDLNTTDGFRNVDDFFRDSLRNLPELTRRDDVGTQPAGARVEQPLLLRFDKVRGCQVDTSSGKDAGEIEELAVDVRNGSIAFALLSTGGFLGLGEDHHAVPWKAFTFTMDPDEKKEKSPELTCRLNIPESKLENAPKYEKDDWKKVNDAAYLERVYTHYGMSPYWKRSASTTPTEHRTDDPNKKPDDR